MWASSSMNRFVIRLCNVHLASTRMLRPLPFLCIAMLLCSPGNASAQDDSYAYKVAPENCLMFSSWSGFQPAAAGTTNHAELMMNEPEVIEFREAITQQLTALAGMAMRNEPAMKQQAVKAMVPQVLTMLLGRPGCLLIESVDLDMESQAIKVEAGLAFDFGDQAEDFLNAAIAMATSEGVPLKEGKLDGETAYALAIPDTPFKSFVFLSAVDGKVLVGVGRNSTLKLIAAAKGGGNTSKPAWLTGLEKQLPVPRRTSVGYINLEAIFKQAVEVAGPQGQMVQGMAQMLGLHNLTSVTSSSGYDETGLVDQARLSWSGPATGLLEMVGTEPLNLKSLENAPADSLFLTSISINLNDVMTKSLALMEAMAPNEAEDLKFALQDIEQEIGLNPQEDVLAHLGSTWTLFNGAGDGLGVGTILTVDLKSEAALKKTVDSVLSMFEQIGGRGAPQIIQRDVAGTTVYTFTIPEMPMPFQPSWAMHENHLWVSLYPQILRPYLDPQPGDEKLDLANLAVEEGIVGYAYQDMKRQYEFLYVYGAVGASFAGMLAEEAGMGPDGEVIGRLLSSITLPSCRCVYRHIMPSQNVLRSDGSGWQLTNLQTVPSVNVTVAAPVMVGLLLPAVQASRAAARRMQSTNNLKQIALALLNYESAYRRYPEAFNTDEDGKPLLSWRVHILPFIEQNNLYQQFHLDEPWDSEHNIKLLDQMPLVYRSPQSAAEPGMTVYLGNGGENGVLRSNPDNKGKIMKGIRLADITDGTSNTILAIEASDEAAVPWTKPTEYEFDEDNMWDLFGLHVGGTNAVTSDGAVHFLSENIDLDLFKALFTRNGGEVVNLYDYN